MNQYFYPGARKKPDTLYLIYIEKIKAYKFGITAMDINERIKNYCNDSTRFRFAEQYSISENDVKIIYCNKHVDASEIEKSLMKMITGCRLKLSGQQYPFREHFTGDNNAAKIIEYLNNINSTP